MSELYWGSPFDRKAFKSPQLTSTKFLMPRRRSCCWSCSPKRRWSLVRRMSNTFLVFRKPWINDNLPRVCKNWELLGTWEKIFAEIWKLFAGCLKKLFFASRAFSWRAFGQLIIYSPRKDNTIKESAWQTLHRKSIKRARWIAWTAPWGLTLCKTKALQLHFLLSVGSFILFLDHLPRPPSSAPLSTPAPRPSLSSSLIGPDRVMW